MVASRSEATAVIDAGVVVVGGALATKPPRLVGAGEPIVLAGPPPRFVAGAARSSTPRSSTSRST